MNGGSSARADSQAWSAPAVVKRFLEILRNSQPVATVGMPSKVASMVGGGVKVS